MRDALIEDVESPPLNDGSINLIKNDLIARLSELGSSDDIAVLRDKAAELKRAIESSQACASNGDQSGEEMVSFRGDVLASELDQILEARTIERAKYYIRRLERGIKKVKTSRTNDINLHRWKEYTNIITDSLWEFPKRDTTGAHLASYWGNFVPQIPHQLMLRYTKKGDWVLDPFVGGGTTLIECRRLGRNGIGVELNSNVARSAAELIEREANPHSIRTKIVAGDARTIDLPREITECGVQRVQLLVMHPPYHNIIGFSESERDLSTAKSVDEFLRMFGEALDNCTLVLEPGRYFALVIGDKYAKGEWVPLGFLCMNEALKRDYSLKSIVVKNFEETRAKRVQKQLWRYRALVGGFYVFKHEYIFVFTKK